MMNTKESSRTSRPGREKKPWCKQQENINIAYKREAKEEGELKIRSGSVRLFEVGHCIEALLCLTASDIMKMKMKKASEG